MLSEFHDHHEHDDVAAVSETSAATPEVTSPGASARSGQVSDILATVSEQVQRLRALQETHEADVESLEHRQRSLETEEGNLRDEQQTLGLERDAVEAARAALEREQTDWQDHHGAARLDLERRQSAFEARDGELSGREQALDGLEQELVQSREELESERSRIDERAAAIDERVREVEAGRETAQSDAERALVEMEQAQDRLDDLTQGLELERRGFEDDAERMRNRFSRLEEELRDVRARAEAGDAEMERFRADAARECDRVESLESELRSERERHASALNEAARLQEELDGVRNAAEDASREIERLTTERDDLAATAERVQELAARLETTERERAVSAQELDAARKERDELAERATDTERLRSGLDAAAAERDELAARVEELLQAGSGHDAVAAEREELREKVAELQQASSGLDAALAERDEWARRAAEVEGLQGRLNAAQAEREELEGRAADADRLRAELVRANEKVAEADRLRLESEAARSEHDAAEEKLLSLESEVEALRRATRVDPAKLDAAIDELKRLRKERAQWETTVTEAERTAEEAVAQALRLEERCDQLQAELEAAGTSPATPHEENGLRSLDAEAVALRRECARLRKELEAARAGAEQPEARSGDPAARAALEAKIAELNAALQHEKGKSSKRSVQDMERHAANVRGLEVQQREIGTQRDLLKRSEKRMARRWARQRSVVGVASVLFMAVISAAAAWFAVDRQMPSLVTASVTVTPQSLDGSRLDDGKIAEWQNWHSELVSAEPFVRAVAQRMEERRIEAYETEDRLQARLDADLTIDAAEPGTIVYTLAGRDRAELLDVLDVVVTTLASESRRQARNRSDGAVAQLRGEYEAKGRVRYAALNSVALEDQRLMYAGILFGAIFAILLVLVGIVYAKLVRAKREFDGDGAIFTDEPLEVEKAA